MRRYLGITRNAMMCGFSYRLQFISSFMGNLALIVVTYFLWKSIYEHSSGMLNGMSFKQVFAYLALAASLSSIFRTWMEWEMSRAVVNGTVVMTLIKPLDYQTYMFFHNLGNVLNNLVALAIPSMVFIVVVFGVDIDFGVNIPFFFLAILLSTFIAFIIDYIIGLMSFYTEIIWGLSTAKDVIIMVTSGLIIPLSFYPESIQRVLMWLPFQAIYNAPLTILTSRNMSIYDCLSRVAIQAIWVIVGLIASKLIYQRAIRVVTVNGG